MNSEVLRRIAERGLASAEKDKNSEYVDIFQHLLDELERSEEDQMQSFIKRMQRGNKCLNKETYSGLNIQMPHNLLA